MVSAKTSKKTLPTAAYAVPHAPAVKSVETESVTSSVHRDKPFATTTVLTPTKTTTTVVLVEPHAPAEKCVPAVRVPAQQEPQTVAVPALIPKKTAATAALAEPFVALENSVTTAFARPVARPDRPTAAAHVST